MEQMDKAALVEVLAVFIWATGAIFISYLGLFFDNYTQNFFRYLAAAALLLPLSLLLDRRHYFASLRHLGSLFLPVLFVFLFQIFYVEGTVMASPTIGTLITRLSVVFADLFSFFLFAEERTVIRDKRFLVGTAVALAGVTGVVLSGSGLFHAGEALVLGAASLLLASVFWAGYTVTLKRSLKSMDPLSATTSIFLVSAPMYLPLSVASNGLWRVLQVQPLVLLFLAISGFLSIGLGNLLNCYVIQELGASVSSNLQLLLPVFAGVLSFLFLGEPMPAPKIVFSGLTLVGCWFILRAPGNRRSL